jgi:hypothetical protein
VQSGFLLDVVIREGATILKLLASKDQTLLVWGDTLLVLDLLLDVINGIGRLDLQGNGLAGEGLDEDLHTTAETEDQVEGRLLLDVVVGQRTTVLELLAGENETLLVWGDTFLILNLLLDVIDGVGRLDLKSDSLAGKGLDKDLHTTTETEDQVEGRLLLDVVVREGAAVLELLAGENQTLLIWGDALLILDLLLNVVDGIGRLNLEGDGLACEGLDENLHGKIVCFAEGWVCVW